MTNRFIRPTRLFLIVFLSIIISINPGCSSLYYYGKSIQGHLEILNNRMPISELIGKSEINEELKYKLQRILAIREFSTKILNLPKNESYLYYSDINRKYVVWNVFATPELSLLPEKWCFLFVGCLSYKGFYSEQEANDFAEELKSRSLDVFVGGVRAYSTLGWFNDPVLNTMLSNDEIIIAKLIFHELAHQKIYFKNDTAFNEAFAETVAEIGVRQWLKSNGTQSELERFKYLQSHDDQFFTLVLDYRHQLEKLYQSSLNDSEKISEKQNLIRLMKTDYELIREHWQEDSRYDSWFGDEINNAKITAVSTYRQLQPSMMNLYNKTGDINEFYKLLNELELCSPETRLTILKDGVNDNRCFKTNK